MEKRKPEPDSETQILEPLNEKAGYGPAASPFPLTISSRMDDSFSEQGARDPQGILSRILHLMGPGLFTELFGGKLTREVEGWDVGGLEIGCELTVGELGDVISTVEGVILSLDIGWSQGHESSHFRPSEQEEHDHRTNNVQS